ncbi:MAG: CrcB family protein [Pseudomonadota bacterium]
MSYISLIAIAAGGAIGALTRFFVHRGLTAWHGLEAAWSTLIINAAGSFLLGIAVSFFMAREGALSTFIMIGLLGAFTTFSTFAMDAVFLFRDKGLALAAIYTGFSVGGSIIGFVLGMVLGKAVS